MKRGAMMGKGTVRKGKELWAFKKVLALSLACIQILTACGGTGAPSAGTDPGEGQAHYEVREVAVPDPDEALAGLEVRDDETYVTHEMEYRFGGDRLYRLVRLTIRETGMETWEEEAIREIGYCLQVLDPPYEAWESYQITASYWDADTEVLRGGISISQIIAAEEDGAYLQVDYMGEDYIGLWREDAPGSLLGVLPEELQDLTLVMGDGRAVGAYKTYSDSLLLLGGESEEVQVRGRVAARGYVWGTLWDPKGERLLWYGLDEDRRTGVWQAGDNAEVARLPEGKGNIGLVACSEEGDLYLANSQEIWRCSEKGEPESLCRFSDLDYYVEDLHGMSVRADGTLLLLAWYEGKDHVLQVKEVEGAVQEKQEVILAVSMDIPVSPLRQAIAQFNRQNREYRVKVIGPENGETGFDFMDRIQREMVAGGKGPDLFYSLGERAGDFARNGYLREVSDLLPEEGVLLQAAVECGTIDGRQYGIPYAYQLHFATYSRELTGDRDAWTLDEMMEAVRESGAEVLQAGASSMDIVMDYGLYDNDNRKFIDWEKGESHLDEAPFLDFLAFAEEYADREEQSWNPLTNPDTRLLEGKVAAKWEAADMHRLSDLNGLYASFQGKPACIGFPREEGNGIYVLSSCFYVSSRTEQVEGCRAFLDFLLSEEAQKGYAEFSYRIASGSEVWAGYLPVRLSALERSIQSKKQELDSGDIRYYTEAGILYSPKGFSEEQEATFRFLLENAHPANWRVQEIRSMFYEELEPYFAGQRTAEEAAGMLHNRVQLYLDENK